MKIMFVILLFVVVFVALIMFSCRGVPDNSSNEMPDYKIVVIDGCEYIQVTNSRVGFNNYSYTLTHKGNCKNPVHVYR